MHHKVIEGVHVVTKYFFLIVLDAEVLDRSYFANTVGEIIKWYVDTQETRS